MVPSLGLSAWTSRHLWLFGLTIVTNPFACGSSTNACAPEPLQSQRRTLVPFAVPALAMSTHLFAFGLTRLTAPFPASVTA